MLLQWIRDIKCIFNDHNSESSASQVRITFSKAPDFGDKT